MPPLLLRLRNLKYGQIGIHFLAFLRRVPSIYALLTDTLLTDTLLTNASGVDTPTGS